MAEQDVLKTTTKSSVVTHIMSFAGKHSVIQ